MEVALRRGAVAEVHEGHHRKAVELRTQGVPHGVQHLRPDGHADVPEPVRGRVVGPAVPGRPVEVKVFAQVDAADHRRPELAVRGEDPVLLGQGERRPDLRGLLSDQRRVHGQLALPLERRRLEVGPPDQRHQPVQRAQVVVAQPGGRDVARRLIAEGQQPKRLVRIRRQGRGVGHRRSAVEAVISGAPAPLNRGPRSEPILAPPVPSTGGPDRPCRSAPGRRRRPQPPC